MVELNKINEIENILSQMNGDLASQFSDLIKSTIIETLNLNKKKSEEEISYNNIYIKHRLNFENWLEPKFSNNYIVSVKNSLNKLFLFEINSILDIKKIIDEGHITRSSGSKSFRVFLNYHEGNDLISEVEKERLSNLIPHSLRSTYAYVCKELNLDNEHIAELLGHDDVKTLKDSYFQNTRQSLVLSISQSLKK